VLENDKPNIKILVAEVDDVVAIQLFNGPDPDKAETQYFNKESFDSVRFERLGSGIWRIRDFK
jgi:hypothetical protein